MVAILLSTYNGERYLKAQLSSFSAQTHDAWLLYWRDDGSSDETATIMRGFRSERCVTGPTGGRMRATGSFLSLLHAALAGPADCFAFADQDDVWLPDKLANGVAALANLPADRPGLYFCARTLVDAALRPVGQVPAPACLPAFPAALTQNIAPGCCMMLNRAAAEMIDAQPAPAGTWHDWWAYLVVSAHEGAVIAGASPDILYRQHDDNLVGEPLGFWNRTVAAARRGRQPFIMLFRAHMKALREGPVSLPAGSAQILAAIETAWHGGWLARGRALAIRGFARRTRAENLLFRLWFILG